MNFSMKFFVLVIYWMPETFMPKPEYMRYQKIVRDEAAETFINSKVDKLVVRHSKRKVPNHKDRVAVEQVRKNPRRENIPKKNYYEEEEPRDDRYVFCDFCEEEYLDVCSKCGGLFSLEDNTVPRGTEDRAMKTAPKGVLEVRRSGIHGFGVFALKNLRKGVRLGPYDGNITRIDTNNGYAWKMRDGRLIDANDSSNSNYLRYVNCPRTVKEQNLVAFQYKGSLYYRTCREILKDEELLVFYGSTFAKNLGIDPKKYFEPAEETTFAEFYACKFCFIGLGTEEFRLRHQKFCRFDPNKATVHEGEVYQCRFCMCGLASEAFKKTHEKRCSKRRGKEKVKSVDSNTLPTSNTSTTEGILLPDVDKEFVIFPGDNGEDIYGFFDKDVLLAMRGNEFISDSFRYFGHNYEDDITFTLYNRAHPDGHIVHKNNENLTKYFDSSKKTKVVTHGWLSSGASETCMKIKDNYLNRTDHNVIVLDWSAISGNVFYPIPMAATVQVADYLGEFINHLVSNISVQPGDVHLIGHSLGAHISGFAGRQVKGLARITGLDPALPGFSMGLVSGGHLSKSDAQFVDIIHTCAGYLGYKEPLGHVDIYPNGGTFPQPGCEVSKFYEACSHGMSWKLFAMSIILRQTFIANKCASLDHMDENECNKEKCVPVGDPTPVNSEGIYFLSTTEHVRLLQ